MNKLLTVIFILGVISANSLYAQFQVGVDQGLNLPLFTDDFQKGYYIAPKIEGESWGVQYSYNKKTTLDDRNLHTFDIYIKEKRRRNGLEPYISYGAGYGFYDLVDSNINGGHGFLALGLDYPVRNMGVVLGVFCKYNGMVSKSDEKIVSGKDILYQQFLSLGLTVSLGE